MLPGIWRNSGLFTAPAVTDFVERFLTAWPNDVRAADAVWAPRVDVHEADGEVILDVELPGIDRKDVKVGVKDGLLTISGERKFERKASENGYLSVERRYGRFERSFGLGDTVDAEKISAAYADGVLTLTVPKAGKAKPREIAIEVK